ncbi:MAG: hypothetical protein ABSG61_00850 [Gemmatimonadales bacterium]|jgi:hypothetical protein
MIGRAPVLVIALAALGPAARAQQAALGGQVSAWVTSRPDSVPLAQGGVRWLPEVTAWQPLGGQDSLALDVSLNTFVVGTAGGGAPRGLDATLKPYRAWLRFGTHAFETRVGLQKITFGSATLFRPLMWFDRVDARDPLQLTDGVTGALARWYFTGNANVWGWALVGNTATKGWETLPTERGTAEVGGRFQTPVPAGEVGVTYDHRDADLQGAPGLRQAPAGALSSPEDRFGLDGKWNLGFGLWGEAALVNLRNLPANVVVPQNQRFWTLGADYTIGVGNGLYVLAEHSRFDARESTMSVWRGVDFSGLYLNYPVGILDRVSAIVYRNWTGDQWYRILTWQRSYDAWTFYLLAFWNPSQPVAGIGGLGGPGQQTQAFAGRGLQLVAAFNY